MNSKNNPASTVSHPVNYGLAAWATAAYNESWDYTAGAAVRGNVDNSGLIYSYVGSGARDADGMFAASETTGQMSDVPEIPGIALYAPGTVGVYIGNGKVITATQEQGISLTDLADFSWQNWFYVSGVAYQSFSSYSKSPSDAFVASVFADVDSIDYAQTPAALPTADPIHVPGWATFDRAQNIFGMPEFCFYDKDGTLASGWRNDIPGWEGSWFYFDPQTGKMQTGWQNIGSDWFCFSPSGIMYQNCTTPDGYTVDSNGAWIH